MDGIKSQVSNLLNRVNRFGVINLMDCNELFEKGIHIISYDTKKPIRLIVGTMDALTSLTDIEPTFKSLNSKTYSHEAIVFYHGIEFVCFLTEKEYKKVVAATTTKESSDT